MNQRPSEFRINPQHPLAQGLVFAGLGRHPKSNFYHDLSLHKNHGTLTNMTPSEDWVWVPELGRWTLDFDGTNDYVDAGNSSSLDFEYNQSFSMGAWIKTTDTGQLLIVAKELAGGTYRGYSFFKNDDQSLRVFLIDSLSAYKDVSAGNSMNDGVWHHVAATYDGSNQASGIKIYKDGISLITTIQVDGTLATISDPVTFKIGARGDTPTMFWNGLIADPFIYNRVLSPVEIAARADPSNAMLSGLILPPRRKLWAVGAAGGSAVKTKKGLAVASVKTVKGLAAASIKTYKGLA